jgi:hypothetical protein
MQHRLACHSMISTLEKAFSVGKYLVSPSTHTTDNGLYTASVSIRSGRGSGTHDRIYRFVPEFTQRDSALGYAIEQAHRWMAQRHPQALAA